MRILLLVVTSLFSMATAFALEWHPGMNPEHLGGSFYQTCTECRVDANGNLRCRCLTTEQRFRTTWIWLPPCRNHSIWNEDGRLLCRPALQGSYELSCRDCYVRLDKLYCSCKDKSGRWISSASTFPIPYDNGVPIKSCRQMALRNVDGRLRCE